MQKLRTEKGITLIALIITIIVMLILVGVTVTVALEGGLFTTAKQATNKTQLELDKEQLLEIALGAMNDKGVVVTADLIEAVNADGRFTHDDGIYTSVKSGNKFVVNEWGGVSEAPEAPAFALSGSWTLDSDIDPIEGATAGTVVSQQIEFAAGGSREYYSDGNTSSWSDTYTSITFNYCADEFSDDVYYMELEFDGNLVYGDNGPAWSFDGSDDNGNYLGYFDRTINFGSTPIEVSEEFYTWFTANATPVE